MAFSPKGFERPEWCGRAAQTAGGLDRQRALTRLGDSRAERQRRLEYFQALIDTVAAAVLVVDPEGRVEFASRAALLRLGEAALAWISSAV